MGAPMLLEQIGGLIAPQAQRDRLARLVGGLVQESSRPLIEEAMQVYMARQELDAAKQQLLLTSVSASAQGLLGAIQALAQHQARGSTEVAELFEQVLSTLEPALERCATAEERDRHCDRLAGLITSRLADRERDRRFFLALAGTGASTVVAVTCLVMSPKLLPTLADAGSRLMREAGKLGLLPRP